MDFHDTPQGRRFFNQDFPNLIRKLDAIADEIHELRLALKPEPPEPKREPDTWFRNYYRCDDCGPWEDEWYHTCDDECPKCGHVYSPYKSEEIDK